MSYSEDMKISCQDIIELEQYRELGTVEDLESHIKQGEEEFNMLMEFRKLGTLEQVREAVERSKPKKPPMDEVQNSRMLIIYVCPVCDQKIAGKGIAKFCYECGQKLLWD